MSEKEWRVFKISKSENSENNHEGVLPFFTPNFDSDSSRCLMICCGAEPIAFWIVGTKYTQNLIDRTVNRYQCRMTEAMFQSLVENIPLIDDGKARRILR
jgi:hypothetical protein